MGEKNPKKLYLPDLEILLQIRRGNAHLNEIRKKLDKPRSTVLKGLRRLEEGEFIEKSSSSTAYRKPYKLTKRAREYASYDLLKILKFAKENLDKIIITEGPDGKDGGREYPRIGVSSSWIEEETNISQEEVKNLLEKIHLTEIERTNGRKTVQLAYVDSMLVLVVDDFDNQISIDIFPRAKGKLPRLENGDPLPRLRKFIQAASSPKKAVLDFSQSS